MTAHIAVSVEGLTEAEFVSKVLRPHLARMGLTVKAYSKNGGVSLASVRSDLRQLVEAAGNTRVTTMYDFYGFGGRGSRPIEQIERELHELVGMEPRFVPYLQCHEFEALIFAGPEEAGEVLRDAALPGKLARIVQECGSPESINVDKETCPSSRLRKLHGHYDKARHGYRIVERIGLAKVRAACPRFGAWLSRLESLGSTP